MISIVAVNYCFPVCFGSKTLTLEQSEDHKSIDFFIIIYFYF